MKYVLVAGFVLGFIQCKEAKLKPHKIPGIIEIFYVNDFQTLKLMSGPAMREIMELHYHTVDSSNKGKYIYADSTVVDTVYLLPNIDSALVIKDSLKRPILTKEGKMQFGASFRTPIVITKSFVTPTTIYFPNAH